MKVLFLDRCVLLLSDITRAQSLLLVEQQARRMSYVQKNNDLTVLYQTTDTEIGL